MGEENRRKYFFLNMLKHFFLLLLVAVPFGSPIFGNRRTDLIYTYLNQGNVTSAIYYTDKTVSAIDVESLVYKLYNENSRDDSVLVRIFMYLSYKGFTCDKTEAGLKKLVHEMQYRGRFEGVKVFWAAEIAYACHTTGMKDLFKEISMKFEEIAERAASQIRNKNYLYSGHLEFEVAKIGRFEWTVRTLTRALMKEFHRLSTSNVIFNGQANFLDVVMKYMLQGTSFCPSPIIVMDELLDHLNCSPLGYDLIFYYWRQRFYPIFKWQSECFKANQYFNCIYTGIGVSGQTLDDLKKECYENFKYK